MDDHIAAHRIDVGDVNLLNQFCDGVLGLDVHVDVNVSKLQVQVDQGHLFFAFGKLDGKVCGDSGLSQPALGAKDRYNPRHPGHALVIGHRGKPCSLVVVDLFEVLGKAFGILRKLHHIMHAHIGGLHQRVQVHVLRNQHHKSPGAVKYHPFRQIEDVKIAGIHRHDDHVRLDVFYIINGRGTSGGLPYH